MPRTGAGCHKQQTMAIYNLQRLYKLNQEQEACNMLAGGHGTVGVMLTYHSFEACYRLTLVHFNQCIFKGTNGHVVS